MLRYNISKVHYDTASLKPIMIRQYKRRYDTAPLKSITIWHLFYKAKMLIWHLFYKAQLLIWHLFCKTQILFWHYFTRLKSILATIYKSLKCYFSKNNYFMPKAQNHFLAKYILKSLTHGKYKLLTSQEYFSQQNLWELCLFFHNQINYKSPCISPMAKLFIL